MKHACRTCMRCFYFIQAYLYFVSQEILEIREYSLFINILLNPLVTLQYFGDFLCCFA